MPALHFELGHLTRLKVQRVDNFAIKRFTILFTQILLIFTANSSAFIVPSTQLFKPDWGKAKEIWFPASLVIICTSLKTLRHLFSVQIQPLLKERARLRIRFIMANFASLNFYTFHFALCFYIHDVLQFRHLE